MVIGPQWPIRRRKRESFLSPVVPLTQTPFFFCRSLAIHGNGWQSSDKSTPAAHLLFSSLSLSLLEALSLIFLPYLSLSLSSVSLSKTMDSRPCAIGGKTTSGATRTGAAASEDTEWVGVISVEANSG